VDQHLTWWWWRGGNKSGVWHTEQEWQGKPGGLVKDVPDEEEMVEDEHDGMQERKQRWL